MRWVRPQPYFGTTLYPGLHTAGTPGLERSMAVYARHVFVCTNGDWCPTVDGDSLGVHARLKSLVNAAGLSEQVRINRSGCFSQCGHGPMVVVYPDGVWYAGVQPDDADEIFRSHIVEGRPVERLRYDPPTMGAHKLARDADGRAISPDPAAQGGR